MIQVPTPADAAEHPAEDFGTTATAGVTPAFWQRLAAAAASAASSPSATPVAVVDAGAVAVSAVADQDLAAVLDDLATSGDEVVARITLPRVGLPRSGSDGGAAALRSVAVERVSRRQELI